MKDIHAQVEKLRAQAADCARLRELATDSDKRELFGRLADHFNVLASEVERTLNGLSP